MMIINELSVVKESQSSRLSYFEDLLCKRDAYYKEAKSTWLAYNKEFGQKIKDNFQLKVSCIKTKKQIAYCQKQINRGKAVNADNMTEIIEKEMELYYEELREIINQYESGKNSVTVDGDRVWRAKKEYRKLAKKLHPDINKKTMEEPKLRELWNRIQRAYSQSDVEELENLEVLAGRILNDLDGTAFEYAFSDVEERIDRVEAQIKDILISEPYIYKKLLRDDEKKKEKHAELNLEQREFADYLIRLTAELDSILYKGGMSIVWQMN